MRMNEKEKMCLYLLTISGLSSNPYLHNTVINEQTKNCKRKKLLISLLLVIHFLYIGTIPMLHTFQSNKKTSHSNTTNTICFYVLIYLDVVKIQKGNAILFLKKKIVWVQKPFRAIIIECEE